MFEPAKILTAARACRATADRAEADLLALAVDWAHAHPATSTHDAAARARLEVDGHEQVLLLAGEGTPMVAEFCIAEFAAQINLPTPAGADFIADALELAHRLPRTWTRIQTGDLPAWRGRRIARQTSTLNPAAAAYVDHQIAPHAHKIGPTATGRLIDEAIARHDPDLAQERRDEALDRRCVKVRHQQVSFEGTSLVFAELDLGDALDLDHALATTAQTLADQGSTDPLDIRRAKALGMLARHETPAGPAQQTREVVLHVHTTPDPDPGDPATVRTTGGTLLMTADAVRDWCGAPATTRILVRPVLDLAEQINTQRYEIPDRLRDQIIERDVTCVFPHCNRTAAACDIDHIEPWDHNGTTSTSNLAALCRTHHRLKTHHPGWNYTRTGPTSYTWTSPHGHRYLKDHTGTSTVP